MAVTRSGAGESTAVIRALAVAVALVLAAPPSARAAPDAARREPPAAQRKDAAGARDPDAELIRHLDEVERLDLLENLELFDPGGAEKVAPPDRSRPRRAVEPAPGR